MKYTPGPMIGAASGSVGGQTASRNRYGAYFRTRAIPTTATSDAALSAKSRLAAASQAWGALTAAQRLSWRTWAQTNPVTDALGQQQVLSGHAAYVGIWTRTDVCGGTPFAAPPLGAAPDALLTLTATWDIGAGDFEITYTGTPLGASEKLYIQAAVCDSPGISYVQNLLKLVGFSAAAQASPFDAQTLIEARFGSLAADQIVHMQVSVIDTTTGLLSAPRIVSGTVVST